MTAYENNCYPLGFGTSVEEMWVRDVAGEKACGSTPQTAMIIGKPPALGVHYVDDRARLGSTYDTMCHKWR